MPTVKYTPQKGLVSEAGGGFQVLGAPITRHQESVSVAQSGTATLSTYGVTKITTTSASGATGNLTLPDGVNIGDQKLIVFETDGGTTVKVVVTNHGGGSPRNFAAPDAGDSLLLVWGGTIWMTLVNSGYTAS